MASIILNKLANVKTLETFGTIDDVEILEIAGTNAKIKFKSASTYTMIVPLTWLFTKTSDGTEGVFAKGKHVSANIQLDEVLTRKGLIIEVGENYVVGKFGERIRMIPFSRLKDISYTEETGAPAVKALPAPGAKPARAAAPAAPKAIPAPPKAAPRKK